MERAELIALLRATGCAEERGECVFLCDPAWSAADRAAAEQTMAAPRGGETGWLGVRTGGSGGGVKFARHDERTLSAAVAGFCGHFGLAKVNAVDVLPPHHISGLMTRVRCAATGGVHRAWDWKKLEAGEAPPVAEAAGEWVISLVPTQLQRLLPSGAAVDWLRRFKIIFLGGGPTWADLADAAAQARLNVSLSYGMTETAAMVTALRPEEFLAGARSCGPALPHAQITINREGVVSIAGESIFRGYFPARSETREFVTEDLGRFDERNHLHLLGRRDAVIISGGKKIHPEDVEAALRASGEFIDVAVIGVPDPEWGQAVVACYPATQHRPNVDRATARLAPHERPKRFVPLATWPRNAQGKVNRAELAARIDAAKA
jgi:O-succinylbenzoic acid--CoA ligase